MNIEEIYGEIDRLYTLNDGQAVEILLLSKIEEAIGLNEMHICIQLLNELIGHYRETGEFDKCTKFCEKLMSILETSDLKGSMAHATSLLNIANAYRAVGLLKESNSLYQQVKVYYDANIDPASMLYASLFNNMSLLFQEMGDFESAYDCLMRALGISRLYPECRIEQASTHANIAATLVNLDRPADAENHLQQAFTLFEQDEDPDYHYSAALSAMAELKFATGQYAEAEKYYEKAMYEIKRHVGESKAYEILGANLAAARAAREREEAQSDNENQADEAVQKTSEPDNKCDCLGGLELSRMFYEEFGRPMIHEKFPSYENRIAVGLVGEGSECFGYDDEISRDHDFGPGFCMWLTDEDYAAIGAKLNEEYERLPKTYRKVTRLITKNAGKRIGAFPISAFYKGLIGITGAPETEADWLYINDERFASCINGRVFRDDLGEFTSIRKKIEEYYPEPVHRKKIALMAARMSQYGQYNYERVLKRGDVVTAQMCIGEFIRTTMQMVYLLNDRYAPYYKWMKRGLTECVILPQVSSELEAIAGLQAEDKQIPVIIDRICTDVRDELINRGLVPDGKITREDNYLDHFVSDIVGGNSDRTFAKGDAEMNHNELVDKIVALEWKAFDKVQNQGGRASCQDDFTTFSIMRKSQYMLWSSEMLESFIADFEEAMAAGRNLITEKYGRMEESTAPDEYDKIKDSFPPLSEEKKQIIEAIVSIQVGMMEEFAKEYPVSAGNARSIHTYEDTPFNTSYETYLRGEISTYSDETLSLYGRFVAEYAKSGSNIAHDTIENSAIMYGYESLDNMEQKLTGGR